MRCYDSYRKKVVFIVALKWKCDRNHYLYNCEGGFWRIYDDESCKPHNLDCVVHFALRNMANQQYCKATFVDISLRSGETAPTTESSIGFVDEFHSSSVSDITFKEELLSPHKLPFILRSHEEQKRTADVSLGGVKRLMDSFGAQRNVTRFSGSSDGQLDKPCSMPPRESSRDRRSNLDCQEVQQCCNNPCALPQRRPSLDHITSKFEYHEKAHDSKQGSFSLKEEIPCASINKITGTRMMFSLNMHEPRRNGATRRNEKDSDNGDFLGYSRTSESATSLELIDVFGDQKYSGGPL